MNPQKVAIRSLTYTRNLLLLLFCCATLSCSRKSDEPVYQGRSLTEWLMDYSDPMGGGDPRNPEMQRIVPQRLQAAQKAVKAIGSNAVPVLLQLIQSSDQKRRDLAQGGFMIIGKDGSTALPSLKRLCDDNDAHVRLLAANCMILIDPTAREQLVEIFTKLSHDADANNRTEASNLLQILTFKAPGSGTH